MRSLPVEEGLVLRPVSEEHVDELFNAVRQNFDHLHEWMQWAVKGYSIKDTRAFVEQSIRQFATKETLNFLIVADGRIAGGIGLNFVDTLNKGTEIGYWLSEDATGKGIVTRCTRRLITYAFEHLAMHRVVIRVASGNSRSRRVPERLGFTEEGTMRECEWLHDRFVDLVVYSMLREEWNAMNKDQRSAIN